MNDNDFIKAAHNCLEIGDSDTCPFADKVENCADIFARFIVSQNANEKTQKVSDLPDFGNLNDTNGIIILEAFKNIVKGLGGRVKSVYADNNEARLEYESGDCGYFLSFGGN